MGVAEERALLRAERQRLYRRDADLQAEHARLHASMDKALLKDYRDRLHQHCLDLEAYHRALDRFHRQYGALED